LEKSLYPEYYFRSLNVLENADLNVIDDKEQDGFATMVI
jgi:hypothetical protein